MTAKHSPATSLPWAEYKDADARIGHLVLGGEEFPGANRRPGIVRRLGAGKPKDIRYIVQASNAYPRLVEALRELLKNDRHMMAEEREPAEALLRELGEAE